MDYSFGSIFDVTDQIPWSYPSEKIHAYACNLRSAREHHHVDLPFIGPLFTVTKSRILILVTVN